MTPPTPNSISSQLGVPDYIYEPILPDVTATYIKHLKTAPNISHLIAQAATELIEKHCSGRLQIQQAPIACLIGIMLWQTHTAAIETVK